MNKFDRLEEFIRSEIKERGVLDVCKEIEELAQKRGLTEGPTLDEFLENSCLHTRESGLR